MAEATAETDRDRRRTLRRRAWGLYSWGSRAHWISTLFATRADVAATLAALSLIGGVGAVTVTDAVVSQGAREATKVAVAAQRVGENATLFGIEGRDEAGRRGTFDVVVLDKKFDWVKGSTTELVKDGRVLSAAEVMREVLGAEVRSSLSTAIEIIAVGTASQEGDMTAETHRAGLRARQTAEWIAPAVPKEIPIQTLNLGQYRVSCTACETGTTSWQRPFVVVAVRSKDRGADIGQALAAAMSDKANLPSLAAYSTFGLSRYR